MKNKYFLFGIVLLLFCVILVTNIQAITINYDNFEDSKINWTKWRNNTYYTTPSVAIRTEKGGYLWSKMTDTSGVSYQSIYNNNSMIDLRNHTLTINISKINLNVVARGNGAASCIRLVDETKKNTISSGSGYHSGYGNAVIFSADSSSLGGAYPDTNNCGDGTGNQTFTNISIKIDITKKLLNVTWIGGSGIINITNKLNITKKWYLEFLLFGNNAYDTRLSVYDVIYSYPLYETSVFEITASNYINSSSICNFTANVGGTLYNSNISACKVTTTINNTQGLKRNITISAGTYFNRTYLNYNTSVDLTGYLYQVIVNLGATEIITDNALTGTFKAGSQTNTSFLWLNAGKTNITFTKSGYWNKTQEFTFTALQNVSRTIENVSNARLKINATDLTDDSAISNFTIDITLHNDTYTYTTTTSTTTGTAYIYLLKNQNYTVEIDAEGYELKETDLIVNAYQYNYTFELYTTNSIQFNFKDAETLANIYNVSFELISDVFSANYSTNTSTYYVDLLSPAVYIIRSSASGYLDNNYFFNLVNRTFTNLTIYLTSNTTGTEVTATVIDEYSSAIEGVYIKVLKYDISTNSYILQEIKATNFEGKTILNLILDSEYYKFILEYPSGTIKKTTSPTYIYSTSINFQINTANPILEDYYNTQDVNWNISFNNATNNFRFTYSDTNNIVSRGCLYVYTFSAQNGLVMYNSSCVNSATSTILVGVANTTGTTYIAKAYVTFTTDTYYLGDLVYTFDESTPFGKMGILLILILTFIMSMTAFYNKTIALILSPLPLLVGSIVGIGVSVFMAVSICIMCGIVAIIISRN